MDLNRIKQYEKVYKNKNYNPQEFVNLLNECSKFFHGCSIFKLKSENNKKIYDVDFLKYYGSYSEKLFGFYDSGDYEDINVKDVHPHMIGTFLSLNLQNFQKDNSEYLCTKEGEGISNRLVGRIMDFLNKKYYDSKPLEPYESSSNYKEFYDKLLSYCNKFFQYFYSDSCSKFRREYFDFGKYNLLN